MAIEYTGPGGISNSYGQRTTRQPSRIADAGKPHPFYWGMCVDPHVPALGAPLPPTMGTAVGGNGVATIYFLPPLYDGGSPITGYTVTGSPGGLIATSSGPLARPIVVSGLAPQTAYTFTVTATNANGTSAPSAPSNAVYSTATMAASFALSADSIYQYIPTSAYGVQELINTTQYQLFSTPYGNSRYAPVNGQVITSSLAATATDSVAGDQVIAEIELQPLSIRNSDSVTLTYRFNASPSFGSNGAAYIRFVNGGDMRKLHSAMSGNTFSGGTVTVSSANNTNGINASESSGSYFFTSGGSIRDLNLFAPIKIQLVTNFTQDSAGRSVTGTLSATLNMTAPSPVGGAVYVDPRNRPFHSNSFWNTPIATGAALQVAGDTETAQFRDRTGSQRMWRSESLRVFQTRPTDPIVNIAYNSRASSTGYWPFKNPAGSGSVDVRFPPNVSVAASGGDNNLAVYSPDGSLYYEFYKYDRNETTGQRSCSVLTIHDLYGHGWPISYNRPNANLGFSTGIRAGGGPLLAGLVRKADFDRGYIDHALIGILSLNKAKKTAAASVNQTTNPVVVAGGSGYVVGEVLTIVGGTGRAAELTVLTVNSGAVASVSVTNTGSYSVAPTGTLTTTSNKAGDGATFTVSTTTNNALSCRVWPATNVDSGFANYNGTVPIGSLWTIPPTVDVTTLGLSPEAVILARGIQQYGMYFMDTSDNVTNNLLCYAGDCTQAQIDAMSGYTGSPLFRCAALETIADQMVMVRNNTPQFPGGPGARGPQQPTVGPYPLFS